MKCFIVFPLLLAGSSLSRLLAQDTTGAENNSADRTTFVDEIRAAEVRHIDLGLTPDGVTVAMQGRPDDKLAPDIWVYWNFNPPRASSQRKFDTLLVSFSPGCVDKCTWVGRESALALMLAETNRSMVKSTHGAGGERTESQIAARPCPIKAGMTPADVINEMGGPADEKLSPSVWIYRGDRRTDSAATEQTDTLLIFFSPGRVHEFRLVERAEVRALMANIRRTAAQPPIAAVP